VAALPNVPHTANPIPLQNEPLVEFDRNPNDLRDRLLVKSAYEFKLDSNGRLAVPTGPGLGIEIDFKVLKEFTTREGKTPRPG
jgi:D-galactarolactone cycloisomerase